MRGTVKSREKGQKSEGSQEEKRGRDVGDTTEHRSRGAVDPWGRRPGQRRYDQGPL